MGVVNWNDILTAARLLAIGQAALRVLIVLVVLRLAAQLAAYTVDKFMASYKRGPLGRDKGARVDTIGTLLRSVARYTIYFVGFLWVLDAVGIPAGSIIAAAGIGGLAIGFGAQNLVRDFISGFFILLEDQYEVGEFVTIDGLTGVIGEVGLRSTRIDAHSGDIIYIANGSIKVVTNHSRADMRAMIDVPVAYREDHNRAIAVATGALERLKAQVDYIVDGPKVMGIADFAESGVVLRVWAKAKNMSQWALEREMRRAIKEAFDREGIEIPFPQRVVHHRYESDAQGGEPQREGQPRGERRREEQRE
jgi:small conductance mechanosensitive channel